MRFLILLFLSVAARAAELPPDPPPLASGLARAIPADAQRGLMQKPDQGLVNIGGTALRLAPGAQIRDGHNRIVLSASLSQPHLVKYLTDSQGQLWRVWILTRAEAAQP